MTDLINPHGSHRYKMHSIHGLVVLDIRPIILSIERCHVLPKRLKGTGIVRTHLLDAILTNSDSIQEESLTQAGVKLTGIQDRYEESILDRIAELLALRQQLIDEVVVNTQYEQYLKDPYGHGTVYSLRNLSAGRFAMLNFNANEISLSNPYEHLFTTRGLYE